MANSHRRNSFGHDRWCLSFAWPRSALIDRSRFCSWISRGSDTDIITSSARAYVSAVNKLLTWNARRNQKSDDAPNGSIGDAIPAEPELVNEVRP